MCNVYYLMDETWNIVIFLKHIFTLVKIYIIYGLSHISFNVLC